MAMQSDRVRILRDSLIEKNESPTLAEKVPMDTPEKIWKRDQAVLLVEIMHRRLIHLLVDMDSDHTENDDPEKINIWLEVIKGINEYLDSEWTVLDALQMLGLEWEHSPWAQQEQQSSGGTSPTSSS